MKNEKEKFKIELKRRIYDWVISLIKFLDKIPHDIVGRTIVDQLARSGTSVGANYIEAQAASSKKDFTNFLFYSLKSANESKFWLAILRDSDKADKASVDPLLREAIEISNILGSSIMTLKGRK